ncbi:MAG: hypothetical protein HYZ68_04470 [Chloroflexi bacterium]|nr:hypothetical protein [Chloroflexota bacterium]
MHRSLLIIVVFALAGLACDFGSFLRPPAEPTPPGQGIVENFDANTHNWFEGPVSQAQVFIADGVLHIDNPYEEELDDSGNNVIDNFVFSRMDCCNFENFDLTVESTQLEGTDNNEIGIVFYAREPKNFFEFAYSGDGFVALFEYAGDDFSTIVEFTPVDAILQGNATNTVRLVVQDGEVTAYINGSQVLNADISMPRVSPIGLGCGAFEAPKVHCTFDNLRITQL